MKISIILPVYEMHGKGREFLGNNLRQIISQDFNIDDYEIIISDNSVNNDLFDLVNLYITGLHYKDKRLKYFKSPKIGNPENLNYALSKASGDLIKIIFQDDYFFTGNCLSELALKYERNKNNWFAFARVQIKKTKTSPVIYPYWSQNILNGVNTISAPSVIAFINEGWQFDENFKWVFDLDFYYRLYLQYGEPFIINDAIIAIQEWEGQAGNFIPELFKRQEIEQLRLKYK